MARVVRLKLRRMLEMCSRARRRAPLLAAASAQAWRDQDLLDEVYEDVWVGFSSSSRGYLGYEVIRPTDIRIVSSKRD